MRSIRPREEHGHLKGGHLELKLAQPRVEVDHAVGHEMVPGELAAAVLALVELLHLGYVVLELGRQRHRHLVRAARPRARVQYFYVHAVCLFHITSSNKCLTE